MLCDKIFRVVPAADARIEPSYLTEVMKTPHLRHQIENSTTGASPTMQNISKPSLLALRLPLPPLPVQRELVEAMGVARAEAARESAAADTLSARAAAHLEARLLGERAL